MAFAKPWYSVKAMIRDRRDDLSVELCGPGAYFTVFAVTFHQVMDMSTSLGFSYREPSLKGDALFKRFLTPGWLYPWNT